MKEKHKDTMRTRQKRLLTSVLVFVFSILIITSVLTKLVDNDMYRGTVETGEDYSYYVAPKAADISYWWPLQPQYKWNVNSTTSPQNQTSLDFITMNISQDSTSASSNSYRSTSSSASNSADIQAVNIAIIVKNVGSKNKTEKLLQDFQGCAESIVRHATRLPLHFVLLTDESSVGALSVVVRNLARVRARVPITVDYVDLDSATRNVSSVIARLKSLFAPDSLTSKYRHELFHVGPVYHRVLPASTSRLLVMDADLRFHADVADLYQEFNQFSSSELMALAPEMSPLYFASFSKHRRTFGSKLGLHDSYPGLNSGIVLYHLTNMRASAEYNALLDSEGALEELCDQYGHYRGAKVGDQDLFTLLGAAKPDWVRMLDCGWNVQLDESMKTHPMYDLYHQCNSDVKLLHGNGGSIIPEM